MGRGGESVGPRNTASYFNGVFYDLGPRPQLSARIQQGPLEVKSACVSQVLNKTAAALHLTYCEVSKQPCGLTASFRLGRCFFGFRASNFGFAGWGVPQSNAFCADLAGTSVGSDCASWQPRNSGVWGSRCFRNIQQCLVLKEVSG